ncbi:unnamed protein product [Lymnaea stagnalis]|uniref:Cysteine dioxygenase n=1 Tax=Lymnaea stagnalis TaxID=6523 RepID=A0AAV2H8Q3_LYMST
MFGFSVLREALKKLNWKDPNVMVNVRKLLLSYESEEVEWKDFFFMADSESSYSAHEVHTTPDKFMMVIIIWRPGSSGPLQDYGGSYCHTKILKGCLIEEHYTYDDRRQTGRRLKLKNTVRLERNRVNNLNEFKDFHLMKNASGIEEAVSLHICTLPLETCTVVDMLTEEKAVTEISLVHSSLVEHVTRL